MKNLVLGLLLACAFSSFILSIICTSALSRRALPARVGSLITTSFLDWTDTNRQIAENVGYNPAVIAFLVIGIVRKSLAPALIVSNEDTG